MRSYFWKSKILVAFVICLFSLMMFAEALPSTAGSSSSQITQGKGKNENGELDQAADKSQSTQAVAANKEEMAEQVKNTESETQPTVKEQESPAPPVKKIKKFPWLLVIAVTLVAGAAVYYFVVYNKKYTLTTNVGTGVNGTPATGTYTYARGTIVNYSYTPASGYSNLVVKIDNVAAAASGTITMDSNHALSASAQSEEYVYLTLDYNLDENLGSPSPGVHKYLKGTSVHVWLKCADMEYIYVFIDEVKVFDGIEFDTNIIMDKDHTIRVEWYQF